MYKAVYYEAPCGDQPVAVFLKELDVKTRAKVARYIELLEEKGPNLLRPYADHVRGKILELRIRYSSNSVRILYYLFHGDNIVLLHAFLKKTDRLDAADIETAERRMNEWNARHGAK